MCFTEQKKKLHIKSTEELRGWSPQSDSDYTKGALEIVQFSSGAVNEHALGLYHLFLGKAIDLLRSCLQLPESMLEVA